MTYTVNVKYINKKTGNLKFETYKADTKEAAQKLANMIRRNKDEEYSKSVRIYMFEDTTETI